MCRQFGLQKEFLNECGKSYDGLATVEKLAHEGSWHAAVCKVGDAWTYRANDVRKTQHFFEASTSRCTALNVSMQWRRPGGMKTCLPRGRDKSSWPPDGVRCVGQRTLVCRELSDAGTLWAPWLTHVVGDVVLGFRRMSLVTLNNRQIRHVKKRVLETSGVGAQSGCRAGSQSLCHEEEYGGAPPARSLVINGTNPKGRIGRCWMDEWRWRNWQRGSLFV